MVSIPRVRWRIAEIGENGRRRGISVMRSLVDAREGRSVPRSVFETRLLRALEQAGMPRPEIQYPVRDGAHLVAVVDFAFPSDLVAIEADGYRWHSGRARFQNDRARRNRLTTLGWRVIHVTWQDLLEQPRAVVEVIRRTLARH
ncbi:MAG: endonuclease domain-containing protein [Actinomycetota bacterium]